MTARKRSVVIAMFGCALFGIAALTHSPVSVAKDDAVEAPCQTECFEVLEETGFIHVFYVDAAEKRHHLSTSLKTEETVVFDDRKAAHLAPNVRRVHAIADASGAAHLGKAGAGCGVDGWGWNNGEQIWAREISNTSGPQGSTRTDARSIYLGRGRALVFTTVTQMPMTGVPTSTTSTAEVTTSRKPGTSAGCVQER
ncbi:MAG: hypothetical protein LW860_00420 [Xanthomonadaceae bacterium]|nr:hypothetical protein [Xanthomonadaceae bacterium]